jgi:PGF-pre-PGF domain-containing protein
MKLRNHHILAIILALLLILIVLAAPTEGQQFDTPNDNNSGYVCIENWTYSEWSECLEGFQARTPLEDLSNCGTMDNISELTRPCETSEGETTNCTEDWDCAEWSDCLQGYRVRECMDRNSCGTSLNRPDEMTPCEPSGVCTEDWVCAEWSECRQSQQTRTCRDVNTCGTDYMKPRLERPCTSYCIEAWLCEPWSECREGLQTRVCSDINTCQGTMSNTTETQECEPPGEGPQPTEEPAEPNITRSYDEIAPEAPARLIVDEPEVGINQISISVRNRVTNVKVDINRLRTKPPEVEHVITNNTGQVYRYLEIAKENMTDTDVRSATIDFEVNKSWVREQKINTSTIRLMRYVNNTWTALPTILVNEDADRFYFQAESPGFSIFAIAGEYMLEKSGIMCIPLDTRCYGDEVQECDLDGLAWTIIDECEFGCRAGGVCNEKPPEEMPAQAEDYVFYLLVAILAVIAILAFAMMVLKVKRKKAAQELEGYAGPPRVR